MDVNCEHGSTLSFYGLFTRTHDYEQGIAVHPDMTYALIRTTQRTDGSSALIVALERLDALSKILGKVEIVAKVQGS